MGTSSFSGPVRSENGFKTIVKNETTGAITEIATLGTAPVALADDDVTLSNAVHSGRFLIVPNGTQDNTYTLPAPVAGAYFCFVYGGVAADATDFFIDTGSDTNFFIGGVTFHDTDDGGDEIVPVFADGDSNSKLQVKGTCPRAERHQLADLGQRCERDCTCIRRSIIGGQHGRIGH